jgi:DedD protein
MSGSQDTEITLGMGKLLVLFFGLVAICALFFGVGFKLGKGSVVAAEATETSTASGGPRPAASKPAKSSPDLTFYKAVSQDNAQAQLSPAAKTTDTAQTSSDAGAAEKQEVSDAAMSSPSEGGYYVQVAAVTKQDDADALVDALKKKQYSAFSGSQSADKLFHVQVGPFSDIKLAESIRTKLVNDGYNPILKK